jgi:Holliday junction resolvase
MTKYESGRRYEYEVMDMLRGHGYEVSRTAGSHGEWDIHARKKVKAGKTRDLFVAIYLQAKATKKGVNSL